MCLVFVAYLLIITNFSSVLMFSREVLCFCFRYQLIQAICLLSFLIHCWLVWLDLETATNLTFTCNLWFSLIYWLNPKLYCFIFKTRLNWNVWYITHFCSCKYFSFPVPGYRFRIVSSVFKFAWRLIFDNWYGDKSHIFVAVML